MNDPGWPEPWQPPVPLHVGLVGEDLTGRPDRQIERVTQTAGEPFPGVRLRIEAVQRAAGRTQAVRVAPGIEDTRQELILLQLAQRRRFGQPHVGAGEVPVQQVERPVRTAGDRVWAVLLDPARCPGDPFDLVDPVIAIGIPQPVEPGVLDGPAGARLALDTGGLRQTAIAVGVHEQVARAHDVKAVRRPDLGRDIDSSVVDTVAVAVLEHRQTLVLERQQGSTRGVEGHVDDRAEQPRHRRRLDLEALRRPEAIATVVEPLPARSVVIRHHLLSARLGGQAQNEYQTESQRDGVVHRLQDQGRGRQSSPAPVRRAPSRHMRRILFILSPNALSSGATPP